MLCFTQTKPLALTPWFGAMTDYLTIALVLFAIGVILLLAEILLPTGGILVVASLLFFTVGVGIILKYGDTVEAAVAIGGLAIGLPAAGFVAVHAWRRMSIGSSLDAAGSAGPAGTRVQVFAVEGTRIVVKEV